MKFNRINFWILMFLVAGLYFVPAKAEIKLPALFTDNMVLQQMTEVNIWGWSKADGKVSVIGSWSKKKYVTTADASGKWKLKIATPQAGGPYSLTISDGSQKTLTNVMIGEVWICTGQSNMEMPLKGFKGQPIVGSNDAILKSKNRNLRLFTVARASKPDLQVDCSGQWQEACPEVVSNFSATGYYFGRLLNELLDVPVGLINCSYSGSNIEAWMDTRTLASFPEIKIPGKKDTIKEPNRTATLLYNGMLYPVAGYGIKGCIWYQGESNYDRPDQYGMLFESMVKKWRELWGMGDFPFYYAQIAPYDYAQLPPYRKGGKFNSAFLRDAQRKAVDKIPNSAMAVLMDIGEEASIHPMNKEVGGKRLAYIALAKTYGIKGFGYASPTFDNFSVKDSVATVTFQNNPNGLTSFGKKLSCFEIAGADHKFYPANAILGRKSITVSAPEVKKPEAVRYAFKDFIVGDLFSTEGLPVSSFRTDNWDE